MAITRGPARSLAHCELTFIERATIDAAGAAAQHQHYCARLEALGVEVVRLAADEAQPDCCFVEDTAVVLDELAIVTALGTASRRGETAVIAAELAKHRSEIAHIVAPATLEGGDVLVVGRRLFVGRTTRTNEAGIAALRYHVVAVRVPGCLHLKSAVTALDDDTLLAHRAFIDAADLANAQAVGGCRVIDVDADEPGAANVLRVGGEIWGHAGYPRTLERIARAGYRVVAVDISELVKAEAALTCLSLLFRAR